MNPKPQEETLFAAALELAAEERAAFLDIDVQSAHLCLLGAHIGGCAHQLFKRCEQCQVRQFPLSRLGDSKVDYLRDGHAVVRGDKDVRRFDVTVNDPLGMCVLHRPAGGSIQRSWARRIAKPEKTVLRGAGYPPELKDFSMPQLPIAPIRSFAMHTSISQMGASPQGLSSKA